MSKDSKSIKTSKVSRMFKLGTSLAKATSTMALGGIADKIKNNTALGKKAHQLEAAKEIIKSMGELKGGLMKIGQMLSITEDLVIPKEFSALFKSLQKSSPPMPEAELNQVFQNSFQKSPQELFKFFNPEPVASASIGQVHEAILNTGERVAVKVQYPKIVKAMSSDLENLDLMDKLFQLIFPGKPDIKNVLEELRDSMLAECDYELEKTQLIYFKGLYKETFPNILIPAVYEEYCSREVLTMEFLDGDTYEDTHHFDEDIINSLGETLYQSFLFSFFQAKSLHTDPQNGNYLFSKDKIIMLDFGSTKHFKQDFVDAYSLFNVGVEKKDFELYKYALKELGIITPQDTDEIIQKHFQMASKIYEPYLKKGKYPVTDLNPIKLLKDFFEGFSIKDRESPREEFLLLDRANLGIFTKLKQWGAHVDWEAGREKYRYPVSDQALKILAESHPQFLKHLHFPEE